jgi:hypothetical protein
MTLLGQSNQNSSNTRTIRMHPANALVATKKCQLHYAVGLAPLHGSPVKPC